jgi:hypothetical protein
MNCRYKYFNSVCLANKSLELDDRGLKKCGSYALCFAEGSNELQPRARKSASNEVRLRK